MAVTYPRNGAALNRRPKARILLVDDYAPNLLALESVLESLGQDLVKADSGEAALRHLLDEKVDLVLMDVNMPGMDGFECARMIQQHPRTQSIPIVFISAVHKTDADVNTGYKIGAIDYVLKPFVPEILRDKVARLVGVAGYATSA